jgi:predicted 3-demethylubiquinone-9 3-methyltransferase (glyoxalase superfamily)
VSWQIVPETMPSPDNPDAFRKMLGMKKLIIADLS